MSRKKMESKASKVTALHSNRGTRKEKSALEEKLNQRAARRFHVSNVVQKNGHAGETDKIGESHFMTARSGACYKGRHLKKKKINPTAAEKQILQRTTPRKEDSQTKT